MNKATARSELANKAVRSVLAFVLAFGVCVPFINMATPQTADAYGANDKTISDVLGVSRAQWLNWLESHEDGYYLGTPYGGYRSSIYPNGDTQGHTPGMNCTGFLYHALVRGCGADPNQTPNFGGGPGAGSWYTWMVRNGIKTYSFNTVSELLNSGLAEKGDIVWAWDAASTTINPASDYNHVMIYWGDGRSDWAWHSDEHGGNRQSNLLWKTANRGAITLVKFEDFGNIELQKQSTNPAMTTNNNCYSLEGAVYGVYSDPGCQNQVDTLTTDINGYAKSVDLHLGNYWIKELQASKGYALNPDVISVSLGGGTGNPPSAWVSAGETPKGDPMHMRALIDKADADGLPSGQGGAGLEGAEYTVKYYDGYFDTADEADAAVAAGNAHITEWVFKTDADGVAFFNDKYKVSGSALPKSPSGGSTLPLGTVTIQETKVPAGYNVDKTIHVQKITDDTGMTSVSSDVHTYNTPTSTEVVERGDLRLVKEVPTSLDDENQAHTRVVVEGVQFQIINANEHEIISPIDGTTKIAPGDIVCTITTDENGLASTKNTQAINGWEKPGTWTGALSYGDYTIHEVIPTAVAEKFKLEHGLTMLPVDDFPAQIANEGQYNVPMLVSNSIPNEPIEIVKQDIESGKEIFASKASFAVHKLNTDGTLGDRVTYTNHYTAQIEDEWMSTNGKLTLPMKLGDGNYAVVETIAPDGYVLDTTPVRFSVKNNKTWNDPQKVEVKDAPIKGTLQIVKTDAANGAAIAGADYTVRANADIITGDGTIRFKANDVVATVTTDDQGMASISDLYLGSYRVYETKAPNGYALDTEEHEVNLLSQGSTTPVINVRADMVDEPSTIRIKKLSDKDETPLSGAEFKIWNDAAEPTMTFDDESVTKAIEGLTNAKAIDSLVIANEADFKAQVADAYVAKAPSTVSADVNFSLNGATHSAKLKVETQFDNDKPKCVVVKLDALPRSVIEYYDANNISHVSSTAIDWTVDATVATNPNAFNQSITTDANGEAALSYLKHGKYHLQETAAPDGYTITDASVIDFEVNDQGQIVSSTGSVLGATGVFTVYNTPQELKTTATDANTGTHYGQARNDMTIYDEVQYFGCTPGKSYEVIGKLVNKDTEDFVVDENGNPITAKESFIADKASGSITIKFVFNSVPYTGTKVVAYEDMYEEGKLFATHADINDEGQTVQIVNIHTTAHDATTLSSIGSVNDEATIIDTVAYEGLTPGETYTCLGMLMDKESNAPYMVNGEPVVANTTFIAPQSTGTIDVAFKFSGIGLAGRSLVVFEDLIKDGVAIATHADINDEGQTINYPGVRTTALDLNTNEHIGYVAQDVTIVDEVEYTNLKPGETYKVSGKLMNRITGKEFLVDDKPVVVEKDFIPESTHGTVTLSYTLPGALLAGQPIVVFEDVFYNDVLVATHADINDEGQTVEYRAKIHTTATDAKDGDHKVDPAEQVTIIDTVTYEGLIPGETYTMFGKLMNKATGSPIQVDGKDFVVSKEFIAEQADGTIDIDFTFDAKGLEGNDVVVFEDCYGTVEGEWVLVGQHADINDEGQTVSIQAPGVPYDKTGATIAGLTSLIALLTLGGASIAACGLRKRKLSSSVEDALNSDEVVS